MEYLYEGKDVRVVFYSSNASAAIITFAAWDSKKDPIKSGKFTGFADNIISSLGYNHVSIQTNKNNWYQTEEIEKAIKIINQTLLKCNVIVTYGSSMGGYACINFSKDLKADFFIAISPQYTINAADMSFEDVRWRYEASVLKFCQDRISSGYNYDSFRLVIYDDCTIDAFHAKCIEDKTRAKLVPLTYSGHPSGGMVNRLYGLKRLIIEVAEKNFEPELFVESMSGKHRSTTEYLYFNMNVDGNKSKLLKRILAPSTDIKEKVWLMGVVAKNIDSDIAYALLRETYLQEPSAGRFHEKVIIYRIQLLSALGLSFRALLEIFNLDNPRKQLFLQVFRSFRNSTDLVEAIRKLHFSPDLLRDVALLSEKKDIHMSLLLMELAHERRPKGAFIIKKIEQYRSQYSMTMNTKGSLKDSAVNV